MVPGGVRVRSGARPLVHAVSPSHEGLLCRGPVGKAWEGSGSLPDAAGHRQGLAAEGRGDGQVGELGVKVAQVRGARLWNGDKQKVKVSA